MELKDLDDGKVEVTFIWSNKQGVCYDCGAPAAYVSDVDIGALKDMGPYLRCSVCAAWDAAHGGYITYLFDEYDEKSDSYRSPSMEEQNPRPLLQMLHND